MIDEYDKYIRDANDLFTAANRLANACRMKDLIVDQLFIERDFLLNQLNQEQKDLYHHLYVEGKIIT